MSEHEPEPRGHYVDRDTEATADATRGHYYKQGPETEQPDEHVGSYTDQQLPDGTFEEGSTGERGHYVDSDTGEESGSAQGNAAGDARATDRDAEHGDLPGRNPEEADLPDRDAGNPVRRHGTDDAGDVPN